MTESLADLLADPAIRERAAKLLRLLASDAAGEAEAARTALLRLLDRHGATFDDLAHGLFDVAPSIDLTPGEASALRTALAASARRAALAEAASRGVSAEAKRLRAAVTRWRAIGIVGAGAGALLVVSVLLLGIVRQVPPVPAPAPASAPAAAAKVPESRPATVRIPVLVLPPPLAELAEHVPTPPQSSLPTAQRGRVLPSEGVSLRLDPVPGSFSIAVLSLGTKVSVEEVFPMLDTKWMQVRTPQGDGFVPASTIGPE